jgi:hypothetical protein
MMIIIWAYTTNRAIPRYGCMHDIRDIDEGMELLFPFYDLILFISALAGINIEILNFKPIIIYMFVTCQLRQLVSLPVPRLYQTLKSNLNYTQTEDNWTCRQPNFNHATKPIVHFETQMV